MVSISQKENKKIRLISKKAFKIIFKIKKMHKIIIIDVSLLNFYVKLVNLLIKHFNLTKNLKYWAIRSADFCQRHENRVTGILWNVKKFNTLAFFISIVLLFREKTLILTQGRDFSSALLKIFCENKPRYFFLFEFMCEW